MTDFLSDSSTTISVTPPGATKPVTLRYPSFAEWHDLAKLHQALDQKVPDASLIAKTIATCLADEDGKPLKEAAVAAIMKAPPRRVMWLYRRCWETVLRSDEETVGELEKN